MYSYVIYLLRRVVIISDNAQYFTLNKNTTRSKDGVALMSYERLQGF